MRKLVLKIIVIELCSAGGCPIEEASKHLFLLIKVLFLVFLFSYFVISLISAEYSCFYILYYIWYLTSGIIALSLERIVG
jgi:hypothetical protein